MKILLLPILAIILSVNITWARGVRTIPLNLRAEAPQLLPRGRRIIQGPKQLTDSLKFYWKRRLAKYDRQLNIRVRVGRQIKNIPSVRIDDMINYLNSRGIIDKKSQYRATILTYKKLSQATRKSLPQKSAETINNFFIIITLI